MPSFLISDRTGGPHISPGKGNNPLEKTIMRPEELAVIGLLALCVIQLVLLLALRRKISRIGWEKRSQSVRYGKLTEQFMPFLESYPYDSQDFRFLGTPIDGVQFTEDSIILVEFKTASSQLSSRQRAIKQMVEEGSVRFEVHRVD